MRRGERGAALLLVVLLVALLAVLVVEFQREARVEARAAENLHDDLQCHALLRSGVGLTEQLLAIYANNSISNLQSAVSQQAGADLLWGFLFRGEILAVPVPSAAIVGEASLRGKLDDLWGRFPLGALVGDGAAPRRAVFRYFLADVKEYLGSLSVTTLDKTNTDDVADAIFEHLDAADDPQRPIGSLLELGVGGAVAADALRALTPFLDTRTDWKFSVNRRCVPLVMAMQGKTVEEARAVADALLEDPVAEDGEIPNRLELGTVLPEFTGSLAVKSRRFQAVLEASVRGGARRARAVFERSANAAGDDRFRPVEWVEGWVEGLEEPAAQAPPEQTPSAQPGAARGQEVGQ